MANINLEKLAKCLNLVKQIFDDEKIALEWLTYPHPSLGKSPLMVLADGNYQLIMKILKEIQNKPFS